MDMEDYQNYGGPSAHLLGHLKQQKEPDDTIIQPPNNQLKIVSVFVRSSNSSQKGNNNIFMGSNTYVESSNNKVDKGINRNSLARRTMGPLNP